MDFVGVQRSIGLIGDLERLEIDAGVHFQRLVGAEARDEAMRRIRLELAQSFLGGNNRHEITFVDLLFALPNATSGYIEAW